MILIVQKAGIKKTLKIKTAKTSSLAEWLIELNCREQKKPSLAASVLRTTVITLPYSYINLTNKAVAKLLTNQSISQQLLSL
ncbi:MAG: hypothetical protein JWQ40_277 [Segetibacter sp.]|nr:hypothetical protein [Segetibacter sp.]